MQKQNETKKNDLKNIKEKKEEDKLEKLTEKEKKDLETTIRTRVKNISIDVKEIKTKTSGSLVNNSNHGIASISIYLFILSQNAYQSGDIWNCIIFFFCGIFLYIVQQVLFVMKIKTGGVNLKDFLDKSKFIVAVGEATGFKRIKEK